MTEQIETIEVRPMCRVCRKKPVGAKGVKRNGRVRYTSTCYSCGTPRKGNSATRRKLRERFFIPCEHCGKVPENISDFEIDHIDRDRGNNSLENLQSLCVPCHRIKTKECGDYLPKAMQIFDETYRGTYKIPQGARMYNFTPFDIIKAMVAAHEPIATHCEAVWDDNDGLITGLRLIVWTDATVQIEDISGLEREIDAK